eukprot:scaffold12831_cov129-Isochrysis_galbana.AAC.2
MPHGVGWVDCGCHRVLCRATRRGDYSPVFQCLGRARSAARRRRVLPRWARRGRCAVEQSDAHRGWRWLVPQA